MIVKDEKAFLGTVYAHVNGDVPNVALELDRMDEEMGSIMQGAAEVVAYGTAVKYK